MWMCFVCVSIGLVVLVTGGCNSKYGPAGTTECVLLSPYYSKYQWATCLTNTYIGVFSKGKHVCRDTFATYCYYQCMIESFDIAEGPTFDACTCGSDAARTTASPPSSTTGLPAECYSPSGEDCDWYIDCLEKRHPCRSTSGGSYAIEYANKFCNLYTQNYNDFTETGKKWINAVRKCLQVKLVPILRPYVEISCQGIQKKAFESHSPCYLQPFPGEPSICDLSLADWARVFWTIKGAFVSSTVQSLKGLLDVSKECVVRGIRVLYFIIKEYISINKLSVTGVDNVSVAETLADSIAKQMKWSESGVSWFAFVANETGSSLKVGMILGEKALYDLNAKDAPSVDLNETIDTLAHNIEDGSITLDVGSKDRRVSKFLACLDLECDTTYHNIDPPIKPTSSTKIDAPFVFHYIIPIMVSMLIFSQ